MSLFARRERFYKSDRQYSIRNQDRTMKVDDAESDALELEDETPFYTIKFTAHTLLDSTEPDTHILKYKATILDTSPVTGAVRNAVGHYDVWRFNVDAYRAKDGNHLYDMFEADSDEAARLYDALFDGSQHFREELELDSYDSDILYFQWGRFANKDKFSALALAAAERIIDCLGNGCCLAAMWPWEKPEADVMTDSPEMVFGYLESQEAYEKHWAKIGFSRIPGTSILIRDLAMKGRGVEEILTDQ